MGESTQEKKKNRKSSTKRLVIVLACCAGAMLLLMALNSIDLEGYVKDWFSKDEEETYYFLYDPDYDSNIYENEAYMSMNRTISYTEGAMTTIITEENNEFGALGQFFLTYFGALEDGDAQRFNSLFTDAYFAEEDNEPYERFTMQKIHDIEITMTSSYAFEEGSEYEGITRYTFKFSYLIMRNDGTFRRDMPSNAAVPQILEVLYDGESYKINSVIKQKLVR